MRQGKDGQVIVEYILVLLMALAIVAIIQSSFNVSVRGVWKKIAKDISKACPKCPDPQ